MYVATLGLSSGLDAKTQPLLVERDLAELSLQDPAWVLMYAVEDIRLEPIVAKLKRTHPDVPVFGATSFQGVFAPSGFGRGVAMLVAERADKLEIATALQKCSSGDAATIAQRACAEIEKKLKQQPDALLLHATPGFEERILEGIRSAFGTEVPVSG